MTTTTEIIELRILLSKAMEKLEVIERESNLTPIAFDAINKYRKNLNNEKANRNSNRNQSYRLHKGNS